MRVWRGGYACPGFVMSFDIKFTRQGSEPVKHDIKRREPGIPLISLQIG